MTAFGVRDGAFVPDLTLWHRWHASRGTLPAPWQGSSLADVARALGVPAWQPVRPWRLELRGATFETGESGTERVTRWRAGGAEMRASWVLGPDGDWWQAEYPVKTADDLPADGKWCLKLEFPEVVSPADRGSDDRRHLAIRVRSVKLSVVALPVV